MHNLSKNNKHSIQHYINLQQLNLILIWTGSSPLSIVWVFEFRFLLPQSWLNINVYETVTFSLSMLESCWLMEENHR